jgi:Ca-activated chloride channel family protein
MPTTQESRIQIERFGLFAIIESKRVVLPLKGIECEFSVRGGTVEVCMTQIFRQENPQPLDCEYLFPLPAEASVYACEADINGRIIRAEVRERGEARETAARKKAEGYRTALVESERDNLFTLGLGNVQPDDLIIVRLRYFQTPRARDETRSLEIPFCPGVRYIPGKPLSRSNTGKGIVDDTNQVPDASRITPVRIDPDHPDAAYVDVTGRFDAAYLDPERLVSPSHAIAVASSGAELVLTLASKGEVPDRDLALRWSERSAATLAPRAWTCRKERETYALMEVRAPGQTAEEETAVDFYFLVDRSGSMEGAKWEKAVEALQSCLKELGPCDRAMITLFEDAHQDLAAGPLPAARLLEDRKLRSLADWATGGGTNMAPALYHVLRLARTHSAGRDRNLILITDAQIGDESVILSIMSSAPDMPVHCFGIDIALNDALLQALARQQGGTFQSLHPNDDIRAAVTKLAKTLRQPVLLGLRLSDGWETAEATLPNLYAGQVLYLSAKGEGEKPLELRARTPDGQEATYQFKPGGADGEAPCLHWRKARIQRWLAEGNHQDAIALSVAGNLLCRLTAFVAWDAAEKVAVARHELVQPSLAPPPPAASFAASATPSQDFDTTTFMRSAPASAAVASHVDFEEPRLPDLLAACQKLGGVDWRPVYGTIADWFAKMSRRKILQQSRTLNGLTDLIEIHLALLDALFHAGPAGFARRAKLLRACELQFRKLRQRAPTDEALLAGLEGLFQRAKTLDASATAAELSRLAKETRENAIEVLKRFAETLWG